MPAVEQPVIDKSVEKNSLLFHELQLGSQLNQCVHSKRRADFSLMLAMLTDDVREHSQFFVPTAAQKDREFSDDILRKAFQLPDKAPLGLKKLTDLNKFSQAELIKQQQLASLHLQNALVPLPLSFYNDKKHLDTKVLSDTSIHCQQRNQQQNQQKNNDKMESSTASFNKLAFFNAKAWLDNIQSSLINGANVSLTTA
jgi:ribosomal S4p-like protein